MMSVLPAVPTPDFCTSRPPIMPSFGFTMFAVAGAVAAAGPIVIHLLNRRRFRVISWAAMDFLREAVKRNRRILKLRDILLLVLRTAAVLLFGLALARPYFAGSNTVAAESGQPLHAILLVDNSMSMGYHSEGQTQTLLEEAKTTAKKMIEDLPDGSRVSIIPLCGGGSFSRDAYRTKKDATDALDRIELTDRATTAARAIDLSEGSDAASGRRSRRKTNCPAQRRAARELEGRVARGASDGIAGIAGRRSVGSESRKHVDLRVPPARRTWPMFPRRPASSRS